MSGFVDQLKMSVKNYDGDFDILSVGSRVSEMTTNLPEIVIFERSQLTQLVLTPILQASFTNDAIKCDI